MPASNITLYAKWTVVQYTITFESNGGSSVTAITQDFGTTVTAPADPTKTGYTFAGWYSDIGLTTPYTFTTMPASTLRSMQSGQSIYTRLTMMEMETLADLYLLTATHTTTMRQLQCLVTWRSC